MFSYQNQTKQLPLCTLMNSTNTYVFNVRSENSALLILITLKS